MKNIDEEYFKKIVANKIKELRSTSQELLAEKADISEDTVSNVEREITVLSSLTLVKICNALNVTPNDLLGEFINEGKDNQNILNEISTLSPKEKTFLLQVIKFIKENK